MDDWMLFESFGSFLFLMIDDPNTVYILLETEYVYLML